MNFLRVMFGSWQGWSLAGGIMLAFSGLILTMVEPRFFAYHGWNIILVGAGCIGVMFAWWTD